MTLRTSYPCQLIYQCKKMDEKMAERFVQRYRQHAKLSQAEAYPFSQRKNWPI